MHVSVQEHWQWGEGNIECIIPFSEQDAKLHVFFIRLQISDNIGKSSLNNLSRFHIIKV